MQSGYILGPSHAAAPRKNASPLGVNHLLSLLLLDLEQESAVDVGKHTTKGNGCANQSVQFLVSADGKLQMARRDTLDLEILGSVACEFQDFGGEVLEDGSNVDGSFGADAHLVLGLRLEETLDTSAWKL